MASAALWTAEEDAVIRAEWPRRVLTAAAIGARLGRSTAAVKHRAKTLGIVRTVRAPALWDERNDPLLIETLTSGGSMSSVARALDLDIGVIRRRADKLDLVAPLTATKRANATKAAETPPQASDADLVAAFLATRKITQLPSGLAAGLSQMEGQFWAVRAHTGGWKEQALQQGINNGSIKK